jgi:ribosomal protein L40E
MAKDKRGMPSKTCVKCGATIHARRATCSECGTEQPKPKKHAATAQPAAAKARKSGAVKRRRRAAPKAQPAPGGLPQAVSFIRQVGGLSQAKKLLGEIEEIKKL